MRVARSIRNNIPESKHCRDRAINAFLEVFMEDNPLLDEKLFRQIANGTVEHDPKTSFVSRKRQALCQK